MPSLIAERPAERYFGNRPIITKSKSRRGSFNKTHTSVRIALLEAYRQLGGVDGLVKWGRESPDLFYPMLRALLPHELSEQQAKDGSGIRVLVYAPQSSNKPLDTLLITPQQVVDEVTGSESDDVSAQNTDEHSG